MVVPGPSRPSAPLDHEANIPTCNEKDVSRPKTSSNTQIKKDFGLIPIPQRLRYDPEAPFDFGLLMNLSFGFAGTFRE